VHKTVDILDKRLYYVYINLTKTERNMLNNTLIKAATARDEDGIQLYINLAQHGLQVNGRKVNSITMYVAAAAEDSEDNWYCDGDLAVNWEAEDDSSYVHNSSMLMRDTGDSNNNTVTMGEFYWESAFTATLHTLLQQHGFSKAAAEDVCTSEWGMQDVGRASYDACAIADEVRAAHNVVVAA
jgi:hypothetical protein